jgi:plasmid maintenance system killer protein
MASLREDTSGQLIILSGFVLCFSLVILTILVNQTMITGYHSSNAVLEFPKHQIRDITSQTRESCVYMTEINQSNNQSIDQLFRQYEQQMAMLYAGHGEQVTLDISEMNLTSMATNTSNISSIWVNITYNNGMTYYSSEPEIIEVES